MKKGIPFKSLQIKEEKTIEICKEVIEIKYDLNWFYLRTIILSYKAIPQKIWDKYTEIWNRRINHV